MRDLEVIQRVNRKPVVALRAQRSESGWHLGLADNLAIIIGHGKRFEIDLSDDRSLESMHKESIPWSVKTRVELLAVQWKRARLYSQFARVPEEKGT